MMELKFDKIGNVLKITVDGRLVAACSEEFKETVSGWLADNRFLLFDLSQMNHIDGRRGARLVRRRSEITGRQTDGPGNQYCDAVAQR